MKKTVIITAGGSGQRMQTEIPKQFLELHGLPVLMHTVQKFFSYSTDIEIIISLSPERIPYWKELCLKYEWKIPHKIAPGGKERFFSVQNALKLTQATDLIAVHDAVRPLIELPTIAEAFDTAQRKGTAVPVCNLPFSLLRVTGKDTGESVNREHFKEVQTPQVFRSEILQTAYRQNYQKIFTDDASVVQYSGNNVYFCPGSSQNIKITTPQDWQLAELLMKNKCKENDKDSL